jgi:hypothetical protein
MRAFFTSSSACEKLWKERVTPFASAGAQFDTGSHEDGLRILKGIARAARSLFATA